jgi:hypothetical protein
MYTLTLSIHSNQKLLKKNMNKSKILMWLGYGALISFAIWFVTGLVLDYFSHIGVDIPLLSDF